MDRDEEGREGMKAKLERVLPHKSTNQIEEEKNQKSALTLTRPSNSDSNCSLLHTEGELWSLG